MKNKPGISWGPDMPINLREYNGKFYAIAYNVEPSEIIRCFEPKNAFEYSQMMKQLTIWNYGSCKLCPVVRAEIDWTA